MYLLAVSMSSVEKCLLRSSAHFLPSFLPFSLSPSSPEDTFIDLRETVIGCLPYAPWLGIEPTTQVRALTQDRTFSLVVYGTVRQPKSHPARAACFLTRLAFIVELCEFSAQCGYCRLLEGCLRVTSPFSWLPVCLRGGFFGCVVPFIFPSASLTLGVRFTKLRPHGPYI